MDAAAAASPVDTAPLLGLSGLERDSSLQQRQQQHQQVIDPETSTGDAMASYGPIAELRHAAKSPVALGVGMVFGGAAPLTNYFTIHLGDLVAFEAGWFRIRWMSPLWILVAGSFALSSKSVYHWGRNIFGEWVSALAMVAMLEGALVLAPHPAIGIAALCFLVLLNAAHYGAVLALRDQADKALEAVAAVAAAVAAASSEPDPSSPAPAEAAAAAAASVEPPASSPEPVEAATAAPTVALVTSTGSRPRALPAPSSSAREDLGDLYQRAVEFAGENVSLSTEALRRALGVRQPTAAALISRLERDGVIGAADPSDRGRRPVLAARERLTGNG